MNFITLPSELTDVSRIQKTFVEYGSILALRHGFMSVLTCSWCYWKSVYELVLW